MGSIPCASYQRRGGSGGAGTRWVCSKRIVWMREWGASSVVASDRLIIALRRAVSALRRRPGVCTLERLMLTSQAN